MPSIHLRDCVYLAGNLLHDYATKEFMMAGTSFTYSSRHSPEAKSDTIKVTLLVDFATSQLKGELTALNPLRPCSGFSD